MNARLLLLSALLGMGHALFTPQSTLAQQNTTPQTAPKQSTSINWSSIIQKIESMIANLDDSMLNDLRNHYTANMDYCSTGATVRVSNDIPAQEIGYLNARLPKVKQALENLLDMTLSDDEVPHIGIACSGGGYRAMLNTVGSLLGAEKNGILDCALYVSGVSGSTWAIAPWVQSGSSVKDLKKQLIAQLTQNFFEIPLDVSEYSANLMRKALFKEPLTIVDIYGILLAENLLKTINTDPDLLYLYAQANRISNGSYPLPIYAAIIKNEPDQWAEMTPYEVGSDYLGSYIPTWSFGRLFNNGSAQNFATPPALQYAPPVSLGFCMGTCGSAFAAIIDPSASSKLPHDLQKIQPELEHLDTIVPALVNNWNYNLANTTASNQELLTLMDGGILINFDLNSLLRRKADIIIILDASADLDQSIDLRAAAAYFQNKFALPPFNYDGIAQRLCTIFTQKDNPSVPMVAYMPQIKNPGYAFDPASCLASYCDTFNFTYLPAETESLIKVAKLNMSDSQATLIAAIKAKVLEKRASKPSTEKY